MAKKRSKTAAAEDTAVTEETVIEPTTEADTSFNLAEFDPAMKQQADAVVQSVADATALPDERKPASFAEKVGKREPFISNPSSRKRPLPNLPGDRSITAGDLVVRKIDKGDNMAGIGIRVETLNGRELTKEEKAIISEQIKDTPENKTGYTWDANDVFWHKHIARHDEALEDIPTARAVAIRIDCERRIERLAESLRQHNADPVAYAEMIRQQRENAAQGHGIPD